MPLVCVPESRVLLLSCLVLWHSYESAAAARAGSQPAAAAVEHAASEHAPAAENACFVVLTWRMSDSLSSRGWMAYCSCQQERILCTTDVRGHLSLLLWSMGAYQPGPGGVAFDLRSPRRPTRRPASNLLQHQNQNTSTTRTTEL